MSSLTELTHKIIDQMPPSTRFQAADAQLLTKYKAVLASLGANAGGRFLRYPL
jgi:hypothetical protein